MQIVIDVLDKEYENIMKMYEREDCCPSNTASFIHSGIPLPKGHGDLIDRVSLVESLNKFAPEHYTALVNSIIEKEPTIIEADKGGE